MSHLAGGAGGQTPLDPDEADGLIPSWVTTRADLDQVEQDSIARALGWLNARRPRVGDILSEPFVRQLHEQMFKDVWKWAGRYRATNKNIGVDRALIVDEIGKLLANATYWVDHHVYPPDEIAVRFHHELVAIHPFANGNGRHTRLAADSLVESLGGTAFSWGSGMADDPVELRRHYIEALRAADGGEIVLLLEFARR
jgi:Fic-DOC domain mobile mystery protein B